MPDETHLEVREIAAAGYRTLRSIRFPVRRLSVFVGANGVGKTNLYRALQLLQAAAAGNLSRELAAEGGMESALWAGKRQGKKPARIRLMVGLGNGAIEPRAGDGAPTTATRCRPAWSIPMPSISAFACRPAPRSRLSRR